jgi:hypothetical protein
MVRRLRHKTKWWTASRLGPVRRDYDNSTFYLYCNARLLPVARRAHVPRQLINPPEKWLPPPPSTPDMYEYLAGSVEGEGFREPRLSMYPTGTASSLPSKLI